MLSEVKHNLSVGETMSETIVSAWKIWVSK